MNNNYEAFFFDRLQLVGFFFTHLVDSISYITGIIYLVGWNVSLVESMNKRCIFLEHAVGLIGLTNVKIVRGRAEVCAENTILYVSLY